MARVLFAGNPARFDSVAHFVENTGRIVERVSNGHEASQRVGALEFDAIISDALVATDDDLTFLEDVHPLTRDRVPTAFKSVANEEALNGRSSRLKIQAHFAMGGAGSDKMRLQRGVDQLLEQRMAYLLAALPEERSHRDSDAWTDMKSLRESLRFEVGARSSSEYVGGFEVLYAPSPRAAVHALANAIWDFPALLHPRRTYAADRAFRDHSSRATGRRSEHQRQIVRLGDEALRREAAVAPEPLRTLMYLTLCGAGRGWHWVVAPGVVLAVAPPVEESVVENVYHRETGPTIRYRDGWGVYALRGEYVPRHVVMAPDQITADEVRGQPNAELRRIYRERLGEGRYLQLTGARVIHVDTVPVDALAPSSTHITRALIEDDESRRFLVASDGSTRRVYHMEVPRECDTCQEAYVKLSSRPGYRTIVQA